MQQLAKPAAVHSLFNRLNGLPNPALNGAAKFHLGLAAGCDHIVRLAQGHGGRLFRQHMLASRRALQHGFRMQMIRQADINDIDPGILQHFSQRIVRLDLIFARDFVHALLAHIAKSDELAAAGIENRLGMKWRDQTGAENSESERLCHNQPFKE